MDKNKIAEHLYDIVNLYSDFKEDNINHEHEKIEFNFPEAAAKDTINITDNPSVINNSHDQEEIKAGKKKS